MGLARVTPHRVGVVCAGGEVLLGPDGVRFARMAMTVAAREQARSGLALPEPARELRQLLEQAVGQLPPLTASAGGSAELPPAPASASSRALPDDPVTTEEAARMLGCSVRRVVQMCAGVGLDSAVKVGRSWLVERAEVLAVQAAREVA